MGCGGTQDAGERGAREHGGAGGREGPRDTGGRGTRGAKNISEVAFMLS